MEENNDIFLLAVMLQCTWPKQCTKNNLQNLFGAIHLVNTFLMTDFSTPLPLYAPVHILDDSPSIPPVVHVLNGWPISQPKNNIQISYSLKYKHLKKNKFFKSHTRPKIFHLISVTLFHINGTFIVHFKFYLSQWF